MTVPPAFFINSRIHLATYGFSLGINDVIPGPILAGKKDEMVEKAYADCQQLIEKAKMGKLENKPGCDQEQTLEALISGVLSKVRGDVGDICMKELSRHNAPLIMATCGSKGTSYRTNLILHLYHYLKARLSTCHKWWLVWGNRSLVVTVYPMASRIERCPISRRSQGNLHQKGLFGTVFSPDSFQQNSCSTQSLDAKVSSTQPSRPPKQVTCSGG